MINKGRTDEGWRHRCEVRAVVRDWFRHGNQFVIDHLASVKRRRGADRAAKLRLDALRLIKKLKLKRQST